MHSHRVLLVGAAMLALTGGLTACGGSGPSKAELERQIDANPNAGAGDPFKVNEVKSEQQQADDDAKAAEQARKRRAELARLDREQQAETDKILNGDGAVGGSLEDSSVPLGSADPDTERFRSRLAGVCDGVQQRLGKVTEAAQKATEARELPEILKAAQDYTDTLNDFQTSLADIDAPASLRDDYADWRDTIDSISSTVRLLLVSQGDREEAARLQRKVNKLTARFLDRSARLGITCISLLA